MARGTWMGIARSIAMLSTMGMIVACATWADAAPMPARGTERAALSRVRPTWRSDTVVVEWNRIAYGIAFGEDQFRTFKGQRAHAMMHLAMHDALNAVEPVYRSDVFRERDAGAHPIVAAARAAHDVLLAAYPDQGSILSAALTRTLARAASANAGARARGDALGRRAAASVVVARTGDGHDAPGSHAFRPEPGAYRSTPGWNGFVLQPGFRSAKPFGIESARQFRPQGPPRLDSPTYATALDEVKTFGRADSPRRTAEQTAYALWWMEFCEGSVNRLARTLSADGRAHAWQVGRLFALLNMSLVDAYIATWDAKYEYDHWRPWSAIREADRDDNPATEVDTTWESLRPAPPFPEYVSAHAAGSAAAFEVLERVFGDGVAFVMESATAPPGMPTRRFARFRDAALECADSRVRLGWHFRYATDAGTTLGRAVAAHVVDHHLGLVFEAPPRGPGR